MDQPSPPLTTPARVVGAKAVGAHLSLRCLLVRSKMSTTTGRWLFNTAQDRGRH